MKFQAILLGGALLSPSLFAESADAPAIDGYITRVASNSDFDVSGFHILCGLQTRSGTKGSRGEIISERGCPKGEPLFLGEPVAVFGSTHKKTHTISADEVRVGSLHFGPVAGVAVIDSQPVAGPSIAEGPSLTVRADGYRVLITGQTEIHWTAPLHSLSDVRAGNWIRYKGTQDASGVVLAKEVRISPDVVTPGEEKLLSEEEFDPFAVPASKKQSKLSMAIMGIDLKRLPPYDDPAVQARVGEIGSRLIPPYQRSLADTDPSKIYFRFVVIDSGLFNDALSMSSGVILIPRQVVERMQNDDQLATVLADNIACALEKQEFRAQPAVRASEAAFLGGMLVPVAGPAIELGALGGQEQMLIRIEEQSGRVSLALLHDAGFDVNQAPLAWRLLAPKKAKPTAETAIPARAAYLYRILGEIWNNPAANAASVH